MSESLWCGKYLIKLGTLYVVWVQNKQKIQKEKHHILTKNAEIQVTSFSHIRARAMNLQKSFKIRYERFMACIFDYF